MIAQRRDVEEDAHEHPRHLRLLPLACLRRRNGLVYNYYYERGRRVVKRRVARADDVFDHPLDWPAPEALLRGDEARPWDAGNVNAVAMGGKHFLTYYSGNETNTTVYVAPAPLAE